MIPETVIVFSRYFLFEVVGFEVKSFRIASDETSKAVSSDCISLLPAL
jgi:hypothetical protein